MDVIKDVKPPIDLPDLSWLLWLLPWFLLILIVVAISTYFILRYKKSPQALVKPQVPQLPAWEQAYQQLLILHIQMVKWF